MYDVADGSERVQLSFGTNTLLCGDDAERREHRDKVTATYALQVLFTAHRGD